MIGLSVQTLSQLLGTPSFLACLEVAEKFVGVENVATMSYINPSYIELLEVKLS